LPEPTALEVSGVQAGYGPVAVLHDISLIVPAKQMVCLIGANGAGKSTLMRVLTGTLPCAKGALRLFGKDMAGLLPHRRVRAGVSLVPEGRQVFGALSVEDNLLLGGFTRTAPERADGLGQAYSAFPALAEKRRTVAGLLSGGQQQMLAIGRALMARPSLLLLDEPSMGLAPLLIAEVFARIARLRDDGLAVLIVEQNAEAALAIADQGYVMEQGRVAMSGDAATLLRDPRVQDYYLGM
jgi:branched-chain amino acid transport system ATP-binding protein